MRNRLAMSLREAPATVPALVAVVWMILLASNQAGYPVTHWAPAALVTLALLAIAAAALGVGILESPLPVRIALACLAGYTALSFVSIVWASVPGDAWDGANRTLLYLLVFALFASWPQRGPTAAALLAGWALAIAGLAAFVALHLDAVSGARLHQNIPGGRLTYPTGYANANAALWLMAFWPSLLLARSPRIPSALRGLLAGGAVLLGLVALLGQSRGSLYAAPVMLVLVFAVVGARVRTFALLVPVAAGIAAAAPAVLRVGDHLTRDHVSAANVHGAVAAILISSLAVGAVVGIGAALERRHSLSEPAVASVRRAIGAAGVVALIAVLAGGLVAAGDPVARIRHGWDTFSSTRGYAANSSGNRLTSGLGSNRYDFFRVALDEFAAHPLLGIGADNYQQAYLVHGRSDETPHYPHSVELRTLSETGVAGALLGLGGLAAALAASWSALRARTARERLGGEVAVAALAGFAYWLVHGSFDWFWEFAGLGAPAFALLGLACALAPRSDARPLRGPDRARHAGDASGPTGRPGARVRAAWMAAGALAVLLAAGSLLAPWLSQLEIQSAARIWTRAPASAYSRLGDAAGLNPLSNEADLVAGSIALRYGELPLADQKFSRALARSSRDAYATLERGAIAAASGRRASALVLLDRAVALNPRDRLAKEAVARLVSGRGPSLEQLNRSILLDAQQLR